MSQKSKWWTIIIAVLLVLNAWQWWPASQSAAPLTMATASRQVNQDDLMLSGYAIDTKVIQTVGRDLFHKTAAKSVQVITMAPPLEKKKNASQLKKTSRSLKKKSTSSGLGRFKLVGILFQKGEKNAYLVKGDKDYAVKKGDKIEGRYLVKEVTVETVTLYEPGTRKSSIITMQ